MIFCSSIAGSMRVYAVSMRSCSLSICSCIAAFPAPMLSSASTMRCSALAIISACLVKSCSMISNCAIPSSAAAVCSMCAFDRKPKIPMLVISISTPTAGTRYNLSNHPAWRQYIFNQTAPTIFASSSTVPIIIIGIAAAAKIAAKPTIL